MKIKVDKIKNLSRFMLGVPLSLASFAFIINFIYSNRSQVIPYLQNFDILTMTAGFFFLTLFFFFRSLVWKSVLEHEGYSIPAVESTYLLAVSELKRYIPGSIFAVAGRIDKFTNFKIKPNTVIRLIAYESVVFIATSFLFSIPAIFYLFQKNNINAVFFAMAAAVTIGFFIAGLKVLEEKKDIKVIHLLKYIDAFSMMFAAWIFYGLGTYLILSSIYFLDPSYIVRFCSIIILSWVAGYAVIIAPLGLGVREAFLTYALSFSIPVGIAAAFSIISRLAFTVSELIFLALSYLAHRYRKFIKIKIEQSTAILWAMIVAYISYFTYYSFGKYNSFFTGRFDLGNMDQTVWNTINGRFFQLTDPHGTETVSRLAFHADFILILLSPFYLIWEDPRMLLLIQSVIIGLGSYFVYKIAEKILDNKNLSLIFSASYLLNPFVQKQNLFDFHAVTLATTLLLASFYFLIEKRYTWFAAFLFLAAITKEQIFAISGFFLLFAFYKTKNIRWFLASIVSFITFYLLLTKFIPDARGGQHFAAEYFQDFGDSPSDIIKNILLNPLKTISSLFTFANIDYLIKLLLPTGFLALLAPGFLIFASPDLLINLLSENENFRMLTFHYAAAIIPFIYISGIYGSKKLIDWKVKYLNIKTISAFLLISALISTYNSGTLPGSSKPSLEIFNNRLGNAEEISDFLSEIDKNLSIASTNNLGSHLSQRERIYTVPLGINEADVVALLLNDSYAQPSLEWQKQLAVNLKNNPEYTLLFESGDFVAFAKRGYVVKELEK